MNKLEQATRAMQDEPVSGAPTELVDRIARVRPFAHRSSSTRIVRWAVAAGVAMAIGSGLYFAFTPRPALAFAEVVRAIEQTRTMTGRIESEDVPGGGELFLSGSRALLRSPKMVSFHDTAQGLVILVDHERRIYQRMTLRTEATFDVASWMSKMGRGLTTPIKPRVINGVTAPGFEGEVKSPYDASTRKARVWVDPDSRLPLRVDMEGEAASFVDLRFDVPIDESVFEIEKPEGYQGFESGIAADRLKAPPTSQQAGELLTLYPGQGIGSLRFGMNREQVIAVLGEPEQTLMEGAMLDYFSKGMGVLVHPRGGMQMILCHSRQSNPLANINDFPGQTDQGITIGSTYEQVIAAYGEPEQATTRPVDQTQQGQLLKYDSIGLSFQMLDDRVISIVLQKPREP